MKRVLGIIASRRKLGNSEIMVKEIARNIGLLHELRLLRLPDFRIDECSGCFRCLAGRNCVLKDDLDTVLQAIAASDAVILAAPTYVLGAPACLKGLLDRAISFYAKGKQLWGKPAVGVGVAGRAGKEGTTLLDLERFFAVFQMRNRMSRVVYGALPGEVLLSEQNRETAACLARALFGEKEQRDLPSCALCGGETFRFLAGGKVRCMLCSCSGTLSIEHGVAQVTTDPGEHQFLMGREESYAHRDDLSGGREKYQAEKARLKEITGQYAEQGTWIKPDRG